MPIDHNRHILFMDKVMLGPVKETLRGVEIFNLNLLSDLARTGAGITMPAHPSWKPVFQERGLAGKLNMFFSPASGNVMLNSMTCLPRLLRMHFDTLLLGNVANGLIPLWLVINATGTIDKTVLIAHREPSRRFLRALNRGVCTIVSVNSVIAAEFSNAGFSDSHVYYGITGADNFHPGKPERDDKVNLCVLGNLDNAWKGADTAIAAFRSLTPETASKCRLHLASYRDPPAFGDPDINAYAWMSFREVAELLRDMDIMIVPSRDENVMRETFSQAMVQGMLTALPCIVNDLPVLTEKIDRGGGLVFRSKQELIDHIEYLAADPGLRRSMGEQARRTALDRYVWDTTKFVEEYL